MIQQPFMDPRPALEAGGSRARLVSGWNRQLHRDLVTKPLRTARW